MNNELEYGNAKFKCPHCEVISQQLWINTNNLSERFIELYTHIYLDYRNNIKDYQQTAIKYFLEHANQIVEKNFKFVFPSELAISECQSCNSIALWINKKVIYPRSIIVDSPNSDMNQDIQDLYNEASLILIDSPKGAAALLRLALQKLLWQIGETERNIDKNIKNLVEKGLNPKIQKALDFVRVVGNEAVHPGEINLDDNKEIAISLFKILNLIANDMITIAKEMDELYEDIIPEERKQQISIRDAK